jgi:hypothetical protein
MKISFLILIICGISILSGCGADPSVKEKQIMDLLSTNLPIGTSVDKVVSFLDSQNTEHSQYLTPEKEILAIYRKIGGQLFVKEDFQVVFTFDSKKQLKSMEGHKEFTGP